MTTFDQSLKARRSTFNFRPVSFRKWMAALGAVRNGDADAKIYCLGDSITRGSFSAATSAQALNGWPVQLAKLLSARNLVPAVSENIFGAGGASLTLSSFDSRITLGTGWAPTTVNSLGGRTLNGTGTGTLSFTPVSNCNTFDIYSIRNVAGGFTVNLDGGSTLATVNTSGAKAVIKTTVTGTLAAHTLNIVQTSGNIFIIGIDCYDSTGKKVRVLNGGWSSATSTSHTSSQSNAYDPLPALSAIAPNLSIICLSPNDWNNATDLAAFSAAMQTIITTCLTYGDVLLMSPPPSNIALTALATQQAYVDAMQALAVSNGIPFLDLFGRWGSYEIMNPLSFYGDSVHPAGRAYADIASLIARTIMTDM